VADRADVDKSTESTESTESSQGSQAPAEARAAQTSDGAARRRPRISMHQVREVSVFVRTRLANTVWLAAVLCATVLALAALLVALDANSGNHVVEWLTHGAKRLAGPLSTVFTFHKEHGAPDEAKNALVNWGITALAYLVAGRFVQRLILPRS